jgi:hypothetical protein
MTNHIWEVTWIEYGYNIFKNIITWKMHTILFSYIN